MWDLFFGKISFRGIVRKGKRDRGRQREILGGVVIL